MTVQIQELEFQLTKEARQRQETERILKKQILRTQESDQSKLANTFRSNAQLPGQNMHSDSRGAAVPHVMSHVSSAGIARSLSAQRSRPYVPGNTALPRTTSSSSSSSSSLIKDSPAVSLSDDTRRTVQELLRMQKGNFAIANEKPRIGMSTATTRVRTGFGNNQYEEDDDHEEYDGMNVSRISISSANTLNTTTTTTTNRLRKGGELFSLHGQPVPATPDSKFQLLDLH
jgi:hypothetical protein